MKLSVERGLRCPHRTKFPVVQDHPTTNKIKDKHKTNLTKQKKKEQAHRLNNKLRKENNLKIRKFAKIEFLYDTKSIFKNKAKGEDRVKKMQR